jgi:iron complex transport system substrate-binding protein
MGVFRYVITGLLLLIVAVACGGNAARQADTSTPVGKTATTPAATASPAESGTRLIKHAMGETEVPANPQRVVVLDEGPLNSALALGIKPVGAVTAFKGTDFPAYLSDTTAGIQNVGTILEPDLEAVAALKPDLILSIKARHEAIYPQLSQIAPTVFTETFRCCWKENFLKDAEALRRSAEANRKLADYTKRLDEFKAKMGDRLNETKVSVVRFVPPGDVYLYQKSSYIGTILADAGLPRPPSQDVDQFVLKVSQEQISEMDGDVIFVTTYGPADQTTLEEVRNHPLWKQLKAVQQGKVYTVPDEYWMVGTGIISTNRAIDDLSKYMVEEG